MHARVVVVVVVVGLSTVLGLAGSEARNARNHGHLEAANPVRSLPASPLGIDGLDELPNPPAPERVRLGRWLFYDSRLSADGMVSFATCHVPGRAFSTECGSPKVQADARMFGTLSRIAGYAPYFQRAFGDRSITRWRVASALSEYQRTRMSGNSTWDRWQEGDASKH